MDETAVICENISKTFKVDTPLGFKNIVKFALTPRLTKNLIALNGVSFSV